MGNININVGLAFLAGLASFLAPCVLPLTPVYLGYLSGYAVTQPGERSRKEHLDIVLHAVFFVLGFTLVFMLLGLAAGALGALLRGAWLRIVGGLLVIFFGLTVLEVLKVPALYRSAQLDWRAKREWGFASSLLIGMVFAAGWTPCVGPALTAILTLSAARSTAAQGAGLLAAYSLGVGLPFILAALLVDRVGEALSRVQRYLPWVHKATGVLLVIVGIIILTDSFGAIGVWLEQRGIGWDLGL